MTSLPLVRTEYLNVSTGTVRSGPTSHGESLVDMESYLMRHDQISSSTLHSWGVADGLSIVETADPASLIVTPGVALDSAGHLIALAEGGFAITDPNVDPTQVANVPTVPVTADGVVVTTTDLTGDRYLTITWREVLDPSSTGNAPTLIHAPWLRLQPVADVSDTGEQVVLAHVVLTDQSQITALTADHRRLAGVTAGRVELRHPRTSVGPPSATGQLPAGELRTTDDGGVGLNLLSSDGTVRPVLEADPSGSLALQPGGGAIGIGLRGEPPRTTVHVEGGEVHSGGAAGGFSFSSRTTESFVENPTAGERWSWYATNGTARLWSGGDQLTIAPTSSGLQLQTGASGRSLELTANGGSIGKLTLTANTIVARRADGTEPITVDTTTGRLGLGTSAPTHLLHVASNTGLRQNSIYLSGGPGQSSLSYNAFRNSTNRGWVFPDPTRPSVTIEMDDSDNVASRFQVYTTMNASRQTWRMRLGIDGDTGTVTIPGQLNLTTGATATGPVSVTATHDRENTLSARNDAGTAVCAYNESANGTTLQAVGGGTALLAWATQAAQFTGNVNIDGTLTADAKRFVIDHPLDPENRYLNHATIESNEQAVVYSGNIECDADGNATVHLPDWLEALASDFRYQLTCVGGQSAVYVSEVVKDNSFTIAGGSAGQQVSWQLTGIRQDAWAKTHEFVVEEDKPENERGFYRSPESFGRDLTASVHWVQKEEFRKRHPLLTQHIVRRHTEHEAARLRAQTERSAPS